MPIYYPSKWGTTLGDNYAMWLRRIDDETGTGPLTQLAPSSICKHTKPLVDAARLRGMRIF